METNTRPPEDWQLCLYVMASEPPYPELSQASDVFLIQSWVICSTLERHPLKPLQLMRLHSYESLANRLEAWFTDMTRLGFICKVVARSDQRRYVKVHVGDRTLKMSLEPAPYDPLERVR